MLTGQLSEGDEAEVDATAAAPKAPEPPAPALWLDADEDFVLPFGIFDQLRQSAPVQTLQGFPSGPWQQRYSE